MIKKIKLSETDKQKISELDIVKTEKLHDFDFSKVIVRKPWGREYLAYENDEIAIWVLHIKKEGGTSMHCHLNKRTNLIVLSGEAICSTLNEENLVKEGDMLILDKGVFHSTKAISEDGCLVMEIETPPEKTDLVRLKDTYGRELKGYELQNEMCFDLSEYERIFLKELNLNRKLGNMNICVREFDDDLELNHYIKSNKDSTNILISGVLENNNEMFEIGDAVEEREKDHKIIDVIKILNIKKDILDFD